MFLVLLMRSVRGRGASEMKTHSRKDVTSHATISIVIIAAQEELE
jgi:hypothetical protein